MTERRTARKSLPHIYLSEDEIRTLKRYAEYMGEFGAKMAEERGEAPERYRNGKAKPWTLTQAMRAALSRGIAEIAAQHRREDRISEAEAQSIVVFGEKRDCEADPDCALAATVTRGGIAVCSWHDRQLAKQAEKTAEE